MNEAKGTILVVDDDQAVRSVVSRKMQGEGYDCITAADGIEALDKAATQTFDIVLLDIKMPGPSGMEVLPQLVTEHPDTCVIMITAVVDTQTAVEAMKQGADDYVTKPFNLDDLSMRVEKALERKNLIRENAEYKLRQSDTFL
jgi:putative two-component system response regulator